jgi:hypothetical protein
LPNLAKNFQVVYFCPILCLFGCPSLTRLALDHVGKHAVALFAKGKDDCIATRGTLDPVGAPIGDGLFVFATQKMRV